MIGPSDLRPQTATTALGERMTFVNRSGRAARVEFHAVPPGHRVFQVPGEISAMFRGPRECTGITLVGERLGV